METGKRGNVTGELLYLSLTA